MNKVNQLQNTVNELKEKDETLQKEIEECLLNLNENDIMKKRRVEIQEQLISLVNEKEKLQAEVDRFEDCNPDLIVQMEEECKTARDAIDRWTGNFLFLLS